MDPIEPFSDLVGGPVFFIWLLWLLFRLGSEDRLGGVPEIGRYFFRALRSRMASVNGVAARELRIPLPVLGGPDDSDGRIGGRQFLRELSITCAQALTARTADNNIANKDGNLGIILT